MTETILPPSFYVSTAIPYVNAPPHLGFAFEAVLADVLARYHRLRGVPVHFQSGTDDHSLKNVRAAEQAGVATAELVASHAARFAALAGALDLSYDEFTRTSVDPRHRPGVEEVWQACHRAGDLYKRPYRGLYCVGCEAFVTEGELSDGRCPEHGTRPDLVEEENWFFRLSRYRDPLVALIEGGGLRVAPASRRREVLAFLAGGLEDISVSRARGRARGWGIPVPGDPEQVIYVWFDALTNYINTLGRGAAYQQLWGGAGRRVHVLGKGIVRFHAVHWPAILLSAGLPLPTDLLVHGYLTLDGQKISKSLGNGLDPATLADRHGADVVRYYLLRHVRPFEDGDVSEGRLCAARDAELADQLGNLVRRTVTLVQRQAAGTIGPPGAAGPAEQELRRRVEALPAALEAALPRFAADEALAAVFEVVAATNRAIEQTAPWALARAGETGRLQTVLFHAAEAVRIAALALAPFLPATSARIAAQLGQSPPPSWPAALRWGGQPWDHPVVGGDVLFAKT
jgi:methionyl-tRNA synthetase